MISFYFRLTLKASRRFALSLTVNITKHLATDGFFNSSSVFFIRKKIAVFVIYVLYCSESSRETVWIARLAYPFLETDHSSWHNNDKAFCCHRYKSHHEI